MVKPLVQLKIEQDSLALGRDRLERQVMKGLEGGTTSSVVNRVLAEVTRECTSAVMSLQAGTMDTLHAAWGGKPGRVDSFKPLLVALDAEVLAQLVIRSVLTAVNRERTVIGVAIRIATSVEDTLWLAEVREQEKGAARAREYAPRNRIPRLVASLEKYGPKVMKRWRTRLGDLTTTSWSKTDRMHVGAALLGACEVALAPVILMMNRPNKGANRPTKTVTIRPSFIEALVQEAGRASFMRPFYMPMVISPNPWVAGGNRLVGGYISLRADGLKVLQADHAPTEGHTRVEDISEAQLNALNKLQSVPWAINNYVLETAIAAFRGDVGPLPYEPDWPIPDRLSDAVWEVMTKEERTAHMTGRALAYSHNFKQGEAKLAHTRALSVAEMFKAESQIYFPHAMDYRTRVYPIPQDLHPQGPDMVKALLMFGTAKALGSRGLVWLEQHAANTYGLDKADRITQQTWTALNWDRIMLVGEDPWLDSEFWEAADEPWQFLAAAHELYQAYKLSNPTEYMCALPVSVDGSCNGLQHLSAMGLDEVGGQAVNLTGGDRSDIYQIVADKVIASIPEDNEWFGKVTRKTVKRAVMTTPYGVTKSGIAEQLKKDGFTDGMTDANKASQYLRDRIVEALDGTIVKGMEIMQWFKNCCAVLASDNSGISWETPTGTVVRMCYTDPGVTRVMTPFGYISILKEYKPGAPVKLKSHKQMNGIAPNIIHSFDAAHLASVINAFKGDVAAVHDSYGTHACDVDDLLEVTKQQFINIYSVDWFARLSASFILHSDRLSMPPAPAPGRLDVSTVLESDYFFA